MSWPCSSFINVQAPWGVWLAASCGLPRCNRYGAPSSPGLPTLNWQLDLTAWYRMTFFSPFLLQVEECSLVPKEFCHLKLDNPQEVTKNVTKKWCITIPQYNRWQKGSSSIPISDVRYQQEDDNLLGDIGDLAGIAINAQSQVNGNLAGIGIQPQNSSITKRELDEEVQTTSNSTSHLFVAPGLVPAL